MVKTDIIMTKTFATLLLCCLTFVSFAQVAITIPGEYEKSEKVIVVWPYNSQANIVISEISSAVTQIAKIEIIFNPDSVQLDTSQIRDFLVNTGSDNSNIIFRPAHSNTPMIRQYSPVTGYGVFNDSLVRYLGDPGFANYNRPLDDNISIALADSWNMDIVSYGLEFENTNIQYDGLRYLFVGSKIVDDNIPLDEGEIQFRLNSYFSSGIVLFIPTLNHSGGGNLPGIDNYIKLIDFETIAIVEIPDSLPDYNNLEDIAEELSTISNYYGYSYNIIRLKSPPNSNGYYPTTKDEELRSYTNSIIINNLVIIPSFGMPIFDSSAYYMYKGNMPGYDIKLVDATFLSQNFSGLHTITKEIPQPGYLRILHKKVTGAQYYIPDIKINCLVNSGDEVENMWLYYKINSDTAYTRKAIQMVCPQHFAVIEDLEITDTVHYYIQAISSKSNVTYPLSAPKGNYSFWFDVISYNPEKNIDHDYKIVPNPCNGVFTIQHKGKYDEQLEVSVFNSNGKKVLLTNTKTGRQIEINKNLDNGIYTVIIKNGTTVSRCKLIMVR
jgi:agmatine/peptidylarginine deiminase